MLCRFAPKVATSILYGQPYEHLWKIIWAVAYECIQFWFEFKKVIGWLIHKYKYKFNIGIFKTVVYNLIQVKHENLFHM